VIVNDAWADAGASSPEASATPAQAIAHPARRTPLD
jgi:hypothetical protein